MRGLCRSLTVLVCFFLDYYVPVNNFTVMSGRSSCVEPVLSREFSALLKGKNAASPVSCNRNEVARIVP